MIEWERGGGGVVRCVLCIYTLAGQCVMITLCRKLFPTGRGEHVQELRKPVLHSPARPQQDTGQGGDGEEEQAQSQVQSNRRK